MAAFSHVVDELPRLARSFNTIVLSVFCGRNPKRSKARKALILGTIIVFCLRLMKRNKETSQYRESKASYLTFWPPDGDTSRTSNITILLWNRKMKDLEWSEFYGDFNGYRCSRTCRYTRDRSLMNMSQLVVFNARRIYQDRLTDSLPFGARRSSQIWIVHGTEPPWKIYLDLSRYPDVFNWTSFPRPDSDVRTFYGNYERLARDEIPAARRKMADVVRDFRNRSGLISWVVSNCHSENGREFYVRQITRHAPVDIFGLCSNGSGLVDGDRVLGYHDNVVGRYKFYLAFENADCRGYITEKLWNALKQGAIPVVMGDSAAYRSFAPPGSYIDTASFKSPAHLVVYLKTVAKNELLQRRYFDWVAKYKLVNTYWCDLCTAAHNWNGVHQAYTDLQGWYAQDSCQTWNLFGFMMNVVEELIGIFYNRTPFPTFSFSWRFSLGPVARPTTIRTTRRRTRGQHENSIR